MAELLAKTPPPVPARWRIFFAAVLVLAFLCGGLLLSRKDAVPSRESADNAMDARIRLQTAAVAFSSGKLAPRVLILTDWPESYRKNDGAYPEFGKFQDSLAVIDPASVPDFGVGGPGNVFSQFLNLNRSRKHDEHAPGGKGDPGAGSLERAVKRSGTSSVPFDVVLLDCAFPDSVFSRKSLLWSSAFFDMMKEDDMNSGGVFAAVLPPDRPEISACILAFLRRSFGNAGAFCFGDRVILASGLDAEPVFELDKLNATAELAGYYDAGGIPGNAIELVLDEDYSDSIPAGLLEASHDIAIPQRVFTPFRAVFARAMYGSRLTRFLPDGFPLQAVCAWLLGIFLAAYPFLRYFISWKPVHKQAFRAFEDMFYLTGALALYLTFTHEIMPDYGFQVVLYLVIIVFVFYETVAKDKGWFMAGITLRHPFGRVLFSLLVPLLFGFAFFLPRTHFLAGFLLALSGLCAAALLVRARMKEWVQPGPAIPLAFVLGVVASLAMFAASLCFPPGPAVFAAVVCAYRLILLD